MQFPNSRVFVFTSAALAIYLATTWRTETIQLQSNLSPIDLDTESPSQSCVELASALPDSVYTHQHDDFQSLQRSAFSAQAQEHRPACIVRPKTAEEVSTIVRILEADPNATFVVRSGGHRPGSRHSSVGGGVLVDLGRINEVTISQDHASVTIGTGSKWGKVYEQLDAVGLSVAGGRNADVGVGGLVLGGGISFFSPQVGMVCDNVISYEVVLANGTITVASSTENADLWRSLKGGGGNLGIVTKFVARAFPTGNVWAGFHFYPFWRASRLVNAFHTFSDLRLFDENAASPLFSLNYVNSPFSLKLVCVNIIHTKPEVWPNVWHGFKAIWPRWSMGKIRTVSEAAVDLAKHAPSGKRQFYGSITIKNHDETLKAIPRLFEESIASVKAVKDLVWTLVLQPLPATITHKGSPNVLGLESRNPSDPTPIIVLLCPSWGFSGDDEVASTAARSLLAKIRRVSIENFSADEYVYLNYAGDHQSPFEGYGQVGRQLLVNVSLKYDPERFFQRVRAGGFKLD